MWLARTSGRGRKIRMECRERKGAEEEYQIAKFGRRVNIEKMRRVEWKRSGKKRREKKNGRGKISALFRDCKLLTRKGHVEGEGRR